MKKLSSSNIKQMLFNETAQQKILKKLFLNPDKEFSLSELAAQSSVRKENIGKILRYFEKNNIITIIRLKTIWQIHANQQNNLFVRMKITNNLQNVYHSGLVDFLNEYYNNPKTIILFGSYRKGEDISTSDIDIAIEDDSIKEYKITELKELTEIEKYLQRKIQIHLFNKVYINKNVFNNIANGIVLLGFLEVNL
ncbi:nucleotidyltransferase domain-containing protein [Candidatus Woesearchaeota archaeon]|nr:nucleotidyltransferase domain-containing protein [Candidatus Woesearchaeota archaeon]